MDLIVALLYIAYFYLLYKHWKRFSKRVDGVDFSKFESWPQLRNTMGYHLAVYLLQLVCIFLAFNIVKAWVTHQ